MWPATDSLLLLFGLGLLLPIYTITGFDASAHTAEETKDASRAVPKGIVNSVIYSALFGWLMLSAFVLAIPDMDKAAASGLERVFRDAGPGPARHAETDPVCADPGVPADLRPWPR